MYFAIRKWVISKTYIKLLQVIRISTLSNFSGNKNPKNALLVPPFQCAFQKRKYRPNSYNWKTHCLISLSSQPATRIIQLPSMSNFQRFHINKTKSSLEIKLPSSYPISKKPNAKNCHPNRLSAARNLEEPPNWDWHCRSLLNLRAKQKSIKSRLIANCHGKKSTTMRCRIF